MISCDREWDDRMKWHTWMVRVDGITIAGVTDETGEPAVRRFEALCKANETELKKLVESAEESREWNVDHPGQGKDWPAFKKLERFKERLLKEAGIQNS